MGGSFGERVPSLANQLLTVLVASARLKGPGVFPIPTETMQTEVKTPVAEPEAPGRKGRRQDRAPKPPHLDPVREAARPLEAEGYRVLSNTRPGPGRIDLIIVGPTGVFVVTTNDWRGRFYMKHDGWFRHSRRDAGEIVWRANRHVVAVKARLRASGIKAPIHGVVAITRGRLREGAIDMGMVMFVRASDLAPYIRACHRSLTREQAARVLETILRGGIPARARRPSPTRRRS